jgi:hypothetical protein
MTREAQKLIFADGEIPTGANYSALIDQIPLIVPLISDLPTAAVGNLGQVYCAGGINYKCTNPSTGVYEWTNMNAAAAANDYTNASNKPKINGVLLSGDKKGDTLKLLSNFSVLANGSAPLTLSSLLATENAGDTSVSVKRTVQDLYDLFGIDNLPKHERQYNPTLTSGGGVCEWAVTHTCKTQYPIVQVFTSGGRLVTNLALVQHSGKRVSIQITSSINIAANEYYVVLIG